MTACRVGAAEEPLTGTAPRAQTWWLVEVSGAWGRQAVADCRFPEVAALRSDGQRRVILVRRPGRHPASAKQDVLRLWIADGSGGSPRELRVPRTEIAALDADPDERRWDVAIDELAPTLAVCANSARDACCGVDGRALLRSLDGVAGVWECSHLGGHRFAPTALQVRQGMVYGRLTHEAARDIACSDVVDARWCSLMRGSPALAAQLQAVQIAVLRAYGRVPGVLAPSSNDSIHFQVDALEGFALEGFARTTESDVGTWPVSCGGAPERARSWSVALSPG